MTKIVKYSYNGNTYDTESPAQDAATQRLSDFSQEVRDACSISLVTPCNKNENSWVVSGISFEGDVQSLSDDDPRNFNFTSLISGQTSVGVSATELKVLHRELHGSFVAHYEPNIIIKSTTDVGEDGLVTEEGSVIVNINTTADFSF